MVKRKTPEPIDCDSCQRIKDCFICIGGDGERMIVNSCSKYLPKVKAKRVAKPEKTLEPSKTEGDK